MVKRLLVKRMLVKRLLVKRLRCRHIGAFCRIVCAGARQLRCAGGCRSTGGGGIKMAFGHMRTIDLRLWCLFSADIHAGRTPRMKAAARWWVDGIGKHRAKLCVRHP